MKGVNDLDNKEFTKELLDNTKIDVDTVLEWAIWKTLCNSFLVENTRDGQKQYIMDRVEKEINKWITV